MPDASLSSRWQPLDQTMSDLELGCHDFEQQAAQLLDEIDLLRLALQEQSELLTNDRASLARREQDLAAQRAHDARITRHLEQQEARVTEALAAVEALQSATLDDLPSAVEELETYCEETVFEEADDIDDSDRTDDLPLESADPIVNSVAAQFAKLQKDVSGRRKKKKST